MLANVDFVFEGRNRGETGGRRLVCSTRTRRDNVHMERVLGNARRYVTILCISKFLFSQ